MILADTHVLVWLYAGQIERFPDSVRERLDAEQVRVSPISKLELQYLHEIGRFSVTPKVALQELDAVLDVAVLDHPLDDLVERALPLAWTRDPFDRLLAAHALAADLQVLTKDEHLRASLPLAIWN